MGWRGAVRTLGAIARQAERDSQRRRKTLARAEAYKEATNTVDNYNDISTRLTSIHKACSKLTDWRKIADLPPPKKPTKSDELSNKAHNAWLNYKPNIFDQFFKLTEKRKEKLFRHISEAEQKEKDQFQELLVAYNEDLEKWKEDSSLAKRIMAKDPSSYKEAIASSRTFAEIADLGTGAKFNVFDDGTIKIVVQVHSESAFPKDNYTVLKSGRVSQKQTPKSEFYQKYQTYICGCVLRMASEIFSLLPVDLISVTAVDMLVDPATGHLKQQPIVSALIPRETLKGMDLEFLSPADSMKNFVHKMSFKKMSGLSVVEEVLLPAELQKVSSEA